MVIDPQREKFYWTGAYEPAVQSALKETLQPGMCFWDVGAHAGFFSLIAARLVGPTGEVRSFEPLVVNRSRLDANAKLNGFAHVFTHGVALGAEESEVEFRRDPSTFKGSLARPHESAQSEKVVVRQTTIDALSDTLAVPDVIKIDAEGAELDVVRGALRLLLGRRPVLIVEIHGPGREAALRAAAPGLVARRLDGCHLLMTSTG
jgi:FkbM family methyltransferase